MRENSFGRLPKNVQDLREEIFTGMLAFTEGTVQRVEFIARLGTRETLAASCRCCFVGDRSVAQQRIGHFYDEDEEERPTLSAIRSTSSATLSAS